MNSDGSATVRARVTVGATIDHLLAYGLGLLAVGLLLAAVSTALAYAGRIRAPYAIAPVTV